MSSHQARATRPRAWASVYSERFPPGPDGPAPGVGHHRPVSPGPGNLPHGQGYPIPCVPVLTASPWGLPLPTPQRLDGSDPQPWGPPWGPAWAHLCEVSTTERPSRTTARRLFHRKRRVLGSMPVVGSSWETAGVRWRETGPAPAPAPAPAPPSASCLCGCDPSGDLLWGASYRIRPFLTGLFHWVNCPPVSGLPSFPRLSDRHSIVRTGHVRCLHPVVAICARGGAPCALVRQRLLGSRLPTLWGLQPAEEAPAACDCVYLEGL